MNLAPHGAERQPLRPEDTAVLTIILPCAARDAVDALTPHGFSRFQAETLLREGVLIGVVRQRATTGGLLLVNAGGSHD